MADNFFKVRNGLNIGPLSSVPANPEDGDIYYDTTLNALQVYQNGAWTGIGGGSLTIGTIDSQTPSADGAVISSGNLYLQSVTTTDPGLLNPATPAYIFAGTTTVGTPYTIVPGLAFADNPGNGMFEWNSTTVGFSIAGESCWSYNDNNFILGDEGGHQSYNLNWDGDGYGDIGTTAGGAPTSGQGNPGNIYVIDSVNIGYAATSGGVLNMRGSSGANILWTNNAGGNVGSSTHGPNNIYAINAISVGGNNYTAAAGCIALGPNSSHFVLVGPGGYTNADLSIVFEDSTDAYMFVHEASSSVVTYGHAPNGSGIYTAAITFDHINGISTTANVAATGYLKSASYINLAEISTPSDPASTTHDLYFKSDGNLYMLNSSGTEVQISGSGSSSDSFTIIQTDKGTSPTASSPTSTLDLTSSDSSITITGNSTTDAVNFQLGPLKTLTLDSGSTSSTDVVPVYLGSSGSSSSDRVINLIPPGGYSDGVWFSYNDASIFNNSFGFNPSGFILYSSAVPLIYTGEALIIETDFAFRNDGVHDLGYRSYTDTAWRPRDVWAAGAVSNGYQKAVPTTGTTVAINAHVSSLILAPAGTLTALTITMPAQTTPSDGQIVRICSTQIITTITLNGNAGQTINGAITTLSANGFASYQWVLADLAWYRIG